MNKKNKLITLAVVILLISVIGIRLGTGNRETPIDPPPQTEAQEMVSKQDIEPDTTQMEEPEPVTLRTSNFTIGLGEYFNISQLTLVGTDTESLTITFSDGTTKKSYTSLGTVTEDIQITGDTLATPLELNLTITVIDTSKPKLLGIKNRSVKEGKKINLLKGVTATDNLDGDLTSKIKVSKVDTNKVGKQKVTYRVTDSSGNTAKAQATVTVKADPFTKVNKTMYVTSSSLNIRKNYNTNAKVLESKSYRSSVKVTATIKDSKWVRIKLSDGTVGYCSSDYLSSTQPPVKTVSKPSSRGSSSSSSGGSKPSGGGSSSSGGVIKPSVGKKPFERTRRDLGWSQENGSLGYYIDKGTYVVTNKGKFVSGSYVDYENDYPDNK